MSQRQLGRRAHAAGLEVVAAADCRYAQARVPRRPRAPRVARDDLHGHLCAAAGRVAPSARRLPAPRSQHAPAALARHGPAWTDPRHGQHPCAPARGRRPRDARPLGGRPHQGRGQPSSVGVLVERTSRLVLLARMDDATAASALAGFTAKLNSIAAPLRQSLTYDQGKEMARHAELAAQPACGSTSATRTAPGSAAPARTPTGCCASTCPRAPTCRCLSQDELDAIADSLNTRPRATHNWHTPLEVFAQTLASSHQPSQPQFIEPGVALRS